MNAQQQREMYNSLQRNRDHSLAVCRAELRDLEKVAAKIDSLRAFIRRLETEPYPGGDGPVPPAVSCWP